MRWFRRATKKPRSIKPLNLNDPPLPQRGLLARRIRVFHICAADCGACAAEVWAAVEGSPDLSWAPTPQSADVVVLTGAIPTPIRSAIQNVHAQLLADQLPLIVVGRCAIDGHPFAKGGVAALPEIAVRRKVDGCPPQPSAIVEAVLKATQPIPEV